MRPRPPMWKSQDQDSTKHQAWDRASARLLGLNSWGQVVHGDLLQASCGHQLSSAKTAPNLDPPASYVGPTKKPKAGAGGENFGQTVPILASQMREKGIHQNSAFQSRSAISPGTEVDIGACESSPADGALFASLSPDQGPARERALS